LDSIACLNMRTAQMGRENNCFQNANTLQCSKVGHHIITDKCNLHEILLDIEITVSWERMLQAVLYSSLLSLLNFRFSQKFKLLRNGEFNHLTINLTLPLTCGPKLPLIKWGPNKWEFNIFKWEIEWRQRLNSGTPALIPC